MDEIPEDVMKAARAVYYAPDDEDHLLLTARAILAERSAQKERWKPAAVYFERYCQDEAANVEDCVGGQQQHEDAKAFAAAIRGEE